VNRRFDIGPIVLAVGALVLLVSLFLDWFGGVNAWEAFELVDLVLAVLALASLAAAVGLLVADLEYVPRRALGWLVAAALVLVVTQLINRPPGTDGLELGLGAWMAFAATVVMGVGAVLSLGKVSLAVAVEGRERRERVRRVAAVDHRPDPTDSHEAVKPVPAPKRSGESLLGSRPSKDPEES
jgi:hypothetical protein